MKVKNSPLTTLYKIQALAISSIRPRNTGLQKESYTSEPFLLLLEIFRYKIKALPPINNCANAIFIAPLIILKLVISG